MFSLLFLFTGESYILHLPLTKCIAIIPSPHRSLLSVGVSLRSIILPLLPDTISLISVKTALLAVRASRIMMKGFQARIGYGRATRSKLPMNNLSRIYLTANSKRGPLGLDEHVAKFQHLLSSLRAQGRGGGEALKKFVYYQCLPKILQRLNMHVVRGGPQMMRGLFHGDAVTKEDFVAQFVSRDSEYWQGKIDQKAIHRGDQLISRLWPKEDVPRFTARRVWPENETPPEWDKNEEGFVHNAVLYDLDAEIAFEIHRLTCSLFDMITTAIPIIEEGRRGSQESPTDEQLARLEGALTKLGEGLFSLSRLVRTPVFWKYLYHPSITAWVQSQGGGVDSVS